MQIGQILYTVTWLKLQLHDLTEVKHLFPWFWMQIGQILRAVTWLKLQLHDF